MTLRLIDSERMHDVIRSQTGGRLSDIGVVADLIRCELWARGVVSRRMISDRIISMIRPVADMNKEDILSTLEEMERIGDVTTGLRGNVAAAPLRAVIAGNGRYRIVGTLPNSYSKDVSLNGMVRELTDNSGDVVASLLEQFGGIRLTAERWAGFEKTLPAGTEWLDQLDSRLENEGLEPGRFDSELNGFWMVYRPSGDSVKQSPWKKPLGNNGGNLWRGWSKYGWPIYLWTSGGDPSTSPSLRLNSDEGTRTTFSLSKKAGAPITFKVDAVGANVVLRIETYLPRAEYRYLMTIAELQKMAGSERNFSIPLDLWPEVGRTLEERLGVNIKATGI